jgi:hypothetical protein
MKPKRKKFLFRDVTAAALRHCRNCSTAFFNALRKCETLIVGKKQISVKNMAVEGTLVSKNAGCGGLMPEAAVIGARDGQPFGSHVFV